jgi:excisionase family DNA binding protein
MSANLLTIPEVAAVFRVPRARAYELARLGTIPGVIRLGKQIRIDEGKLRAFLDAGGTSGNLGQPTDNSAPAPLGGVVVHCGLGEGTTD